MQSVMRSESGKQVRMSGDAKVQDRSEKRNDLVEQFSESREALKRAMEKDIQTVRKTVRAHNDDTQGRTPIVEEHDANATRLAALLAAARNQEAMPPVDAASAPTRMAERPATSPLAAPSVRPSLERQPDLIPRPDAAGWPEMGARPIAEPVLPPLVGREEKIETVSPIKVALRLVVLAVIIGAAAYSYLIPKAKDATGIVPGSAAVAPTTSSEPSADPSAERGVAGDTGTATDTMLPVSDEATPAATAKAPTSDTAMPAVPASVKEGSASAVHSSPAPAAATEKPPVQAVTVRGTAASAAPVVPANIRPPVARTKSEIPAPPEPTVVRPSRASKVESVPAPVGSKPTVNAVSTAAPAAVAPPVSAAAGAVVETGTTALTPPAPPPENPLAENATPTSTASADAANSLQPPAEAPRSRSAVVDRRPYFQRLGPTPARNPFRSVPQPQQPPQQSPTPFSRSVYGIE